MRVRSMSFNTSSRSSLPRFVASNQLETSQQIMAAVSRIDAQILTANVACLGTIVVHLQGDATENKLS